MANKINITFLQRKARPVGNYSLEFIFDDVRNRLAHEINSTVKYSTYESNGILKRLYNTFEAYSNQNDITHVTGDVNYIGCMLRKATTIHTILDCVALQLSTGIKQRILKLFWLTIPIKKARYITAISTATKLEILKYAPNTNPNKIVVIPVAISAKFVMVPKVFNTAKPNILQLGTAINKNIERLIQALSGISCTLTIVGAYHKHIHELLVQHNIDHRYIQNLTNDEILQEYSNADIVTLISTYEGFGMPILEAQATGRVVITASVFSMPEVAGDAAHIVDPLSIADMQLGFTKIINDAPYRNELINRGYNNIKRYDPDLIANMYLDLYKKIISNK